METLQYIISMILPGLFTALGLVHFYWAVGGTKGLAGSIPEKDGGPLFSPTFGITSTLAMGLFVCTALVLDFSGRIILPLQPHLVRWGLLAILALFLGRMIGDFNYMGIFKKVKGTLFATRDDKIYSPLSGLIALMIAILLR